MKGCPPSNFKPAEVVARLLRHFTGDNVPQGIPLVVFVDEIDGISTQEGMTGLLSELKSLYESGIILPLVAGNLSVLFAKGIALSRGSHKPFWLQPLSSVEDLETLLEQRLQIEKPRLETIPNPEPEGQLLYPVCPFIYISFALISVSFVQFAETTTTLGHFR